MKSTLVAMLALCAASCGGPITPIAPTRSSLEVVGPSQVVTQNVTGTWKGTSSHVPGRDDGLIVLAFAPHSTDNAVSAEVTWTSLATSASYAGHVTGTLSVLRVTAIALPGCTFFANAVVSGDSLSGNYRSNGCPSPPGVFTLRKVP